MDVSHSYTSPPFTLSIPTLTIPEGEVLSIVGRSGVGKTTLLSLILGIVEPQNGRIFIGAQTPSSARSNGAFGVAFQNPSLLPWLTIFENAALPWRLQGTLPNVTRIESLLSNVGLLEYRDAYPTDLSGGMKSRLSLARAVALEPCILVLDEPFSSLDEFTRLQMATLVSRLQQVTRSTMILVTHNATEAILMSDRILLLGRLPGGQKRTGIIREFRTEFRNSCDTNVINSEAFRASLSELARCFNDEGRL
nr:ATP-binding cassette domain-containing protein [Rhodopseudomonas palustris]